MSSLSKKRKIAEEKRTFQDKWETLYFVTEVKDRAQCLICSQVIAVLKEYNVRRQACLASFVMKKLSNSMCHCRNNETFFTNINKSSEDSVKASFVLSEMIAKSLRPFTEGPFIKECFVKACEILCPDKKKVYKGISLSANTVASRITEADYDLHEQLVRAAQNFEAFSVVVHSYSCSLKLISCHIVSHYVSKSFIECRIQYPKLQWTLTIVTST